MSASQAGPALIPSAAARRDWRYRAIIATRGNQTALGAILIAVLGKASLHSPPRYGTKAMITKDGVIAAPFENRHGERFQLAAVGMVANIVTEWRRLGDAIKASDAEREQMFAELRKWIVRDDRAEPNRLE